MRIVVGALQRIKLTKDEIVRLSKQYDLLAENGRILEIPKKDKSEGGASKEDLLFLYDNRFSKKSQLPRKYYDGIILLAPNGKCPQCGQRQVRTLDHYLPKSEYPLLAITPYNLIPCCSDCNKDKLDKIFTSREMETIHPYYDNFDDEIWLKATLIEQEPIAFNFFTCHPSNWSELKYKRAKNHFEVFDLNNLYKPCAAEMIITEIGWINRLLKKCGEEIAKQEIIDRISDEHKRYKNTWKSAVYEAIYISEWFWKKYLPSHE